MGAFGARQVFDSAFAENTNEYVPPLPGFKGLTKLFGGEDGAAREEAAAVQQAEVLRQRITDAAAAGDIETAYRSEKELKQVRAYIGVCACAHEHARVIIFLLCVCLAARAAAAGIGHPLHDQRPGRRRGGSAGQLVKEGGCKNLSLVAAS